MLRRYLQLFVIAVLANMGRTQTGSTAPSFDYEELNSDGGPGTPSDCDDPPLRNGRDVSASQATCDTCPGGVSPIETRDTYNDTGDPVLLHNGAVSYRTTDLFIPGRGVHFELTRRYNSKRVDETSRGIEPSVIGNGWEFSYDQRLYFDDAVGSALNARLQNGNNKLDIYQRGSTGTAFLGKHGVYTRLYYDGTYWVLRARHGSRSYFEIITGTLPAVARLVKIEDASGNALLLSYNTSGTYLGQLATVTDSLGRDITFTYTTISGLPRLQSVKDYVDREVVYDYDSVGNLVSARSPTVSSTEGGDFSAGRTERYDYDSAGLLASIARPREVAANPSAPTPYVTFEYHTTGSWWLGWVKSQTLGVDTINYYYTTGATLPTGYTGLGSISVQTEVTDRRGNVTRYWFNTGGQVLLKEEVVGSSTLRTSFAYNADGEVTQIVRPRGNIETRTYHTMVTRFDEGNLASITHSRGAVSGLEDHPGYDDITILYTWDPVFNNLLSRTDARNSAWKTEFVLDYMEGSADSSDPNYVAPAVADLLGISVGVAEGLLSGVVRNADLNGDGIGGASGAVGVQGLVIQRIEPTVDLTQAIGTDNQAGVEGDGSQEAITTWTYNQFGQVTSQTDAEENLSLFAYTPEDDLDSDGVLDGGSGAPTTSTGGYPRQSVKDTSFSDLGDFPGQFTGLGARGLSTDIGRNQGPGPAPAITKRTTDLFYNLVGDVIAYVDARGVRHEMQANELGEVYKVIRGVNATVASTRNGGAPEEEAEAHLSGASFSYARLLIRDANGMVISVQDTDSVAGGSAVWETNYEYDLLNNLRFERQEKAHGTLVTTEKQYDENENVSDIISDIGYTTHFEYDARDQLIETHQGLDLVETLTYDENGNLDSRADGEFGLTSYVYDEFDRVLQITDANGNVEILTYDKASNVLTSLAKMMPASGSTLLALRSTVRTYDERSRAWRIDWNPEGGATVTDGSLDTSDPGVNRRLEYDRLSRLTFVTEDDSEVYERHYDGLGRLVWMRDPIGNVRQGSFDDQHNLVKVTETDKYPSPSSDRTFWTWRRYDALGRLISFTNKLGETDRYEYDARDLVTASSDAEATGSGGTIHATTVNPPGNTRRYTYDGRGLRTHEFIDVRPGGVGGGTPTSTVTLQQIWDDDGRLFQRIDDNGKVTEYVRDYRGRVLQEIFDDGTEIVRTYDGNDRIVTQLDERGNQANIGYDALGNLETISLVNPTSPGLSADGTHAIAYTLDGFGRRTETLAIYNSGSLTAQQVRFQRTFDAFDRLLTENSHGSSDQLQNSWAEEGKRTRVHYPTTATSHNDFYVEFVYDELDRIRKIQRTINPTSGASTLDAAVYKYAGPDRKLSRSLRNRQSTRWYTGSYNDAAYYDDAKRQTLVEHEDLLGPVFLGSFGHDYNRAGARKTELRAHDIRTGETSGHGDNYELDSLYRLIGFERRVPSADVGTLGQGNEEFLRAWDLDGVHNWVGVTTDGGTPVSNTVDDVNNYTSFDGAVPAYDDDGNLLMPDGSGSIELNYDFMNRLVGVHDTATDKRLEHVYDAEGRRVRTIFHDGVADAPLERVYVYDGWEVIEEHDLIAGTPNTWKFMRRYVMGVDIDEPISMEVLPGQTGTRTFHYMQSTLGNVVGLTDNGCNVVERYTYDAYGAPRFENSSNTPLTNQKSAYGNPYLFTGRRYEPWILPLYEFRNRFYLPAQGRFVQRDPLGMWGDPDALGNGFAYSSNSPNDRIDPCGLDDINLIPKVVRLGATKDPTISKNVDLGRIVPNEFTVALHGDPHFGIGWDSLGDEIEPGRLADMIKAHPKFKNNPKIKVRLRMCYGGKTPESGPNKGASYAQRVANALGTKVSGPTCEFEPLPSGGGRLNRITGADGWIWFDPCQEPGTGGSGASTGVQPVPPVPRVGGKK